MGRKKKSKKSSQRLRFSLGSSSSGQNPETPASSTGADAAVSPTIGSPAGFELTSFTRPLSTEASSDQYLPLSSPSSTVPPLLPEPQGQSQVSQNVSTATQPRSSSEASAAAYRRATRPHTQGRFSSRLSEPNRRRLQAAHKLPDFEAMEEMRQQNDPSSAVPDPGFPAPSDFDFEGREVSRAQTVGPGTNPYASYSGLQHQQPQYQLQQPLVPQQSAVNPSPPRVHFAPSAIMSTLQQPQYQLPHQQPQFSDNRPQQQQHLPSRLAANPAPPYVQLAQPDNSPALSALTPSSYAGPRLSDSFGANDVSSTDSGGQQQQQNTTASSSSLLEGNRTFDEISFASVDTAPSDEPSVEGSVQAPFSDQVKTLNALLTSPDRGLGPLGRTSASNLSPEEEDDYLGSELKDLEDSQRQLQRELDSAQYRMLVETPEGGEYSKKQKTSRKGSLTKQRLFQDDDDGRRANIPINEEGENDDDEIEEDRKLPATARQASDRGVSGVSSPRRWMQLLGFGRSPTDRSVSGSQMHMRTPTEFSSQIAEAGADSSAERTGQSLASSDSLFHSLGLFADQISTPDGQDTPDTRNDPFEPSLISPDTTLSTPPRSTRSGPGEYPATVQSTGMSLRLLDEALETPQTPSVDGPFSSTYSPNQSSSLSTYAYQELSSPPTDHSVQHGTDRSQLSPDVMYSRPTQNAPQLQIDDLRGVATTTFTNTSTAGYKDSVDDPLGIPGFSFSDSLGSHPGSPVFEADESSVDDEEEIYFEYKIDPQKDDSLKRGSYEPATPSFDTPSFATPSFASTTTPGPTRVDTTRRKLSSICKYGFALVAVLAIAIGLGVGLGGTDGPGAGGNLIPDMGTGGGDDALTNQPSVAPSFSPTTTPVPSRSVQPSYMPSYTPSPSQSFEPTHYPSSPPSLLPTIVPSSAPSLSPTIVQSSAPSKLPPVIAPLDVVSIHLIYDILIKSGAPFESYSQDLIDSMDALATEVFLDLEATFSRRLRRRKLMVMLQLPTDIEEFEEIKCPVPNGSGRCEKVSAVIVLKSGEDVWESFKTMLEVAVAVGRLQYYLNQVNPDSPVTILDAEMTDSPTSSPTQEPTAALMPPVLQPTIQPSDAAISAPVPPSNDLPIPSLDLLDFLVSVSFDAGDALRDHSSAQYKAYLWLSQNKYLENYSEKVKIQRYVMATLYYSTNGDNWFSNEGWLDDDDECYWFSKSGRRSVCSPGGSLKNLELDYNNLSGVLPPELGLLSDDMERIVLIGGPTRVISGTLPTELGLLTKLSYFKIRGNTVSGQIPTEFGRWSNVQHIDVSHNMLVGSLPTELGKIGPLSFLEVGTNNLSGFLPTQIGLLTSCLMMHLEDNLFSGAIPSEVGRLNKLQDFLAGNNFFSSFPSEMGRLTFADVLSVYGNELRGTLPTDLGRLRRLSKSSCWSICFPFDFL